MLLAGMDIYSPHGQPIRTSTIPIGHNPKCLRVFRDEVSRHVIDEAKRLHSEAIVFHFDVRVEDVNLQKQTIRMQLEGEPSRLVRVSL